MMSLKQKDGIGPSSVPKKYCCGCNSRTSTILANVFLMAVSMLYFATGIFGLTDKTASAPNPQERIFLQGVLVVTFIQIIISVLAIWGAVGYRSWPVMLSLAWVSIQMALGVVGCIVMAVMTSQFRGLIIMLGSFLIQFSFFWMPMKGYLHDHEQLKTEANNYEITELGERQGPGGFSDTKTEAENSVEMV